MNYNIALVKGDGIGPEIVEGAGGVDHVRAVVQLLDFRLAVICGVGFVVDFAHDLLKKVFHRDNSAGFAVLVDHDRHVLALPVHRAEHRVRLHGVGDEERLADELGKRAGAVGKPVGQVLLGDDDAHDFGHIVPIDRIA